eukprot:gene10287-13830_t
MIGKKFRSRKLILILAFLLIDTNSIVNYITFFNPPAVNPTSIDNTNEKFEKIPLSNDNQVNDLITDGQLEYDISNTLWLLNEESGLCLGPHGFSECGEVNIWNWNSVGKNLNSDFLLESASVTNLHTYEETELKTDNTCLGRSRTSRMGELRSKKCSKNPLSTTLWKYDFESGKLSTGGITSQLFGSKCVTKSGTLAKCWKGSKDFARLKRVNFALLKLISKRKYSNIPIAELMDDYPIMSSSSKTSVIDDISLNTIPSSEPTFSPTLLLPSEQQSNSILDYGFFKCPISGLLLPRNLDNHFKNVSSIKIGTEKRQVLMGTGVYSRVAFGMNFKIYTIGWYVEAKAVQEDESFIPYKDKSFEELIMDENFYSLMTKGSYERTILVKLAMTLKTELIIQGLVEELHLKPLHSKLLSDASKIYEDPECPEGLEILFTWRHNSMSATGGVNNGNGNNNLFSSNLEVRIGKETYIPIYNNEISQDFIYQFFRPDEPVTDSGKLTMIQNFPLLLQTGYVYTPSIIDDNNNQLPLFTKPSLQSLLTFKWILNSSKKLNNNNDDNNNNSDNYNKINQKKRKMHHRWQIYFNNMLLTKLSLPPALLRKGVHVVSTVKKRSFASFQRTISKTKSLVELARPRSNDFEKIYRNIKI